LRVAGSAGLVFVASYLVHVVLQSPGPAGGSPATVAAYFDDHRTRMLLGEVINGIGLLAFVPFVAALVGPLQEAGERTGAMVVLVNGTVFAVLGLVSTAAETALVRVAGTGVGSGVLTLFELQAKVLIVFAVTAFTGASALALLRTGYCPAGSASSA
jgi:hypothetical protein